ncbi:MAG: hypothetical protein R3A78_01850 [Polyangiales bacterium]|nr:hypothetical protein [Myxococcales bacterium]
MTKRMFRGFAVLTLVGACTVAIGSHASAQSKARGPRVIQLEEFKIEGTVQKPNAFYILNRSNIGYEVLDLRTSFLKEIIRSVQHEPF